jgi:hypothetical protein
MPFLQNPDILSDIVSDILSDIQQRGIKTNDFGIVSEIFVKHPKTSLLKHQAFRTTTSISSTSRCMITGLASPTFVAIISAPQQTTMTPKQ